MPDIKLGDTVPDFEQDSTHGTIKFYDYLGDSWGILFSHPKDYTVRTSFQGLHSLFSGSFPVGCIGEMFY